MVKYLNVNDGRYWMVVGLCDGIDYFKTFRKDMGICIFYADGFNYLSIVYATFNESMVVDVKDIPEDIVRKFSEYIESDFLRLI